MSRLAAVVVIAMLLLQGDPSIADMLRRYVQIRLDAYDMKTTVCPDE
jgi:hypothetical protein